MTQKPTALYFLQGALVFQISQHDFDYLQY
jgi:hypothetical protein